MKTSANIFLVLALKLLQNILAFVPASFFCFVWSFLLNTFSEDHDFLLFFFHIFFSFSFPIAIPISIEISIDIPIPILIDISISIFIHVDILTGGETHFPHLNISVTPKKGRALLWPSTYDHNHALVRT